jgi:chemotaxis protein MotD
MTKLNGTSGQILAGIAETINARTTARSGQAAGGQASGNSSFNDLLHTVSKLAKKALSDQNHESPVKPGGLRARVARLAERDEFKDETLHERPEAVEQSESSHKSAPLDEHARAEIKSPLSPSSTVGQELAVLPASKPQAKSFDGDRGAVSARTERSSISRALPDANAVSVMKADISEPGTRPSTAASQVVTAPQGNAASSKNMPAGPGFEAVAANIEHAAKVSGREALREATKVTVVQQETHLPPAAQFTATQQVANAVVAELEGSPAPASSAALKSASPPSSAPDQPLKILTISLEPPALGNVTVRLRLVGTAVSVHLAAERRDTSQMLDQQRDSIRELMQSAGYVADVAPVQHGALDGFQAGSGQPQPSFAGQQQSPQGQGTLTDSGTSSGQSQGGANQARQDQQPNQETPHDQDVAPHIRRGPVYL